MALLIGSKKIKTAVFISGNGSNLKALIKFSKLKKSPISIDLIISNNTKSKGLYYGSIYKIKKRIFNFENKSLAEKKILRELKKDKIDLICLAGFMKILSKKFIKNFKGKILNIHPSLLPRWRGPSPIESSILEGDKITGVSLMQMTEELDAGPVYEQRSISINGENTKTLSEKLTLLAGEMIESFLPSFFEGDIKTKHQDERLATESKIIKKEDARIDWNETSEVIDSKIKAYYPWPVAHTYLDDKYLRILDSEAIIGDEDGSDPGQIVDINKKGVIVKCKGGKIILKGIQPEGKKEMLAADFARGNKLEGKRFS